MNNLNVKVFSEETKPILYFKKIKKQLFILVKDNGKIIDFLSFKHNYQSKEPMRLSPNNYPTTTCIDKSYRNKGIGGILYKYLENNLEGNYKLPYQSS